MDSRRGCIAVRVNNQILACANKCAPWENELVRGGRIASQAHASEINAGCAAIVELYKVRILAADWDGSVIRGQEFVDANRGSICLDDPGVRGARVSGDDAVKRINKCIVLEITCVILSAYVKRMRPVTQVAEGDRRFVGDRNLCTPCAGIEFPAIPGVAPGIGRNDRSPVENSAWKQLNRGGRGRRGARGLAVSQQTLRVQAATIEASDAAAQSRRIWLGLEGRFDRLPIS